MLRKNEDVCSLIQNGTGSSNQCKKQEEIKDTQIGKEELKTVIICGSRGHDCNSPNESTKKNITNKVRSAISISGYKITYKNYYTSITQNEHVGNDIKSTMSLISAPKKMRSFGKHFTKQV